MDLHKYDVVVINTSGGKDSQSMMGHMIRLATEQGYSRANILAVHADLGRVEWQGTSELAESQAQFYGIGFIKVRRELGDLLEQVEKRGMWPAKGQRYCTSDQKRDQIGKVLTRLQRERGVRGQQFRILNCIGLRAQESAERAKKSELEPNTRASNKTRTVDNWYPILSWTEDQVWSFIRESGAPYHPAYDLGMPRLSCVFCIFAPTAALVLAGKHNPELLEQYVQVERKIGHTFKDGLSMAEVKARVDADQEPGEISGEWAA